MTQEDKELLLKSLCARIPNGVKCNAVLKQVDGSLKNVFGTFKGYNGWATVGNNLVDIETVRPYLRPMSSMTDEEYKEFSKTSGLLKNEDGYFSNHLPEWGNSIITEKVMVRTIDWLNSHHFDYRRLIERGLAIEVTEENNPYKKSSLA